MTVVYPDGVPSLGATKLVAATAVALLTAPDLSTEIGAVTSVEVTGYLYADGYNPTGTQGKGTRRRRLGATTTKESLNAAQHNSPTIQYTHDPGEIDSATGNEAREAFAEGTEWFFIERRGPDSDEAFAIGDRTRTHHLRMGKQFEMDEAGENGEFYVMQETEYVNQGPVTGVVVA